jgi:UDP-2-acetamido-2-deoxy-ribo-hexuluronate aminotransferase
MRHVLLDVNVVVDLCVDRAGSANSRLSVALAKHNGSACWVYVGSIQTLEYVVADELFRQAEDNGSPISRALSRARARFLLQQHTAEFQWLAALASEGDVFGSHDPEDEQIIRALDRFPSGSATVLTRDKPMLERAGERATTPECFIDSSKQAVANSIAFVDLNAQQDSIRPSLESGIHRVLHHGQYILGPEVGELERRLATFTGAQHCISVSSGTDALLISLMALGIGPGDEVITTPFTFVATAEVIVLLGATPVFVDIEPDTCNIDAALIEAKITARTKAIMPVSLYGQPADMDAINAIAARHGNLPVIEDAAQSFGAMYKGKRSCNLSTFGCTSFFPSKPLGCYGDGGAIFTSDDALAQACREIRVHGQSKRYVHTRIGVGGRMDTLQAAVVLAKLQRFDHEVAQRQAVARRYQDLLTARQDTLATSATGAADAPIMLLPWPTDDRTSVFAQYTLLVQDRPAVQERLHAAGIPTAVHYPIPLNRQPAYAHLCCPDCTPIAARISQQVMSLPMHADLGASDQARIVNALRTNS